MKEGSGVTRKSKSHSKSKPRKLLKIKKWQLIAGIGGVALMLLVVLIVILLSTRDTSLSPSDELASIRGALDSKAKAPETTIIEPSGPEGIGLDVESFIDSSQSDELEAIQAWQAFIQKYGNKWSVEWDLDRESPSKIHGFGIPTSFLGTDKVTLNNIDALAREFLVSEQGLLKIDQSKLIIKDVQTDSDLFVVSYQQHHQGVPVFGSYVVIAVKNDKIIYFKTTYKDGIDTSTNPLVTENEAIATIQDFFGLRSYNGIENNGLIIFPKQPGNFRLMYDVDLPVTEINNRRGGLLQSLFSSREENENKFVKYKAYLDAVTKNIIYEDTLIYDTVSGTVTGMVYDPYLDTPQIEVPIKSEWISLNSQQVTTDSSGFYQVSGLVNPVAVDARLEGDWARVLNIQQEEAHHVAQVDSPTTHDWNWFDDDPSYKQEETNAFYHTNVIHDYITAPHLNVSEMDFQMPVNVNLPSSCNAHYTPGSPSINFYQASSSCESSALDAGIIYHEYGHGIHSQIITIPWPYQCQTGNMMEGTSDYWACTITNDSCLGKIWNAFECLRNCENTNRWPEDATCQPHSGAEIVSGSFWDVREVLGAAYTDSLLVKALRLQPASLNELLENTLIADDDNEDLSDGTPNIDLICSSFWDNHGILVAECGGHTNTGIAIITIPDPTDGVVVSQDDILVVEGTAIGGSSDPLTSYTLEYVTPSEPVNWITDGITNVGGEVTNGILGTWNLSNASSGLHQLRLTINYGGNTFSSAPVEVFVLDPSIRSGWPISGFTEASPLIGDLDGNGNDDVIIGAYVDFNNQLLALNGDGELLTGWENNGMDWISSKSVLGDLDNDGDKEAIFTDERGKVRAYNQDGTLYWEYQKPSFDELSSPALMDIDADGTLEVIFGSRFGEITALDHQGNLLWVDELLENDPSTPLIGDVNDDGVEDIVVTTYSYFNERFEISVYRSNGTRLYEPILINSNGFFIFNYDSAFALADLDNDGDLEIIVGLPDGTLRVWHHDGELMWEEQISLSYQPYSPVVGDIDNDGDLEIVFSTERFFYIFDHEGNMTYLSPLSTSFYGPKVGLYDITGDNNLEIFVPSNGKIKVYQHDGTQILLDSLFSIENEDFIGAPAIGDLDSNGLVDIVITSDESRIYAWEIEDSVISQVPTWPERNKDNSNTGCYECDLIPQCSDELDNDGDGLVDLDDLGCASSGDFDESNCGDFVCEGEENLDNCFADCFAGPVCPTVLDLNLQMWMTFDLLDGNGNPIDSSPNGNDGVLFGGAQITNEGIYGKGLNISGSGDYGIIEDSNSLDLTSEYTISAWIYRNSDSGTWERILIKRNGTAGNINDWSYFFQLDPSDVVQIGNTISDGNTTFLIGTTPILLNQWYHVVGIKNQTGFTIYVNGEIDSSGVTTEVFGDSIENNFPIYIGKDLTVNGFNFDGLIDEIMIFDRALTNLEISELFNAQGSDYVSLMCAVECYDEIDNDNDGLTDFPLDLGCLDYSDNDESNCGDNVCEGNETTAAGWCFEDCGPLTECVDNVDNDGDGDIDVNDPGCWENQFDPSTYDPLDNDESNCGDFVCEGSDMDPGNWCVFDCGTPPECSDNIDNDGDGEADINDSGCWADEQDQDTYDPTDNDETNCGDNVCEGGENPDSCFEDCQPMDICTAEELNTTVRFSVGSFFTQICNIDLSDYPNFEPIGYFNNPFTGGFDGNGFVISNYTYDDDFGDYVGIFGSVAGGLLENIELTNVDVTGRQVVGSLVGEIYNGAVLNSKASGSVIGIAYVGGLIGGGEDFYVHGSSFEGEVSCQGPQLAGGLIGYIWGGYGEITNSFSTGSVNCPLGTGGLIGAIEQFVNVSESYSESDVNGSEILGGLVGGIGDESRISDSYSRGEVISESVFVYNGGGVAGLIGTTLFFEGDQVDAYIINSYSSGLVDAINTVDTGGLAGRVNVGQLTKSPIVTSSYWDVNTSNQSTSFGGEGKSTTQMILQSTYEGWDFVNIWDIDQENYRSYPFLRGLTVSCQWDLDGDGEVGITDFLILLANWGDPYGITEFLAMLANWGSCP